MFLTVRVHPFPFRTRKLSSPVPTILVWRRTGKIGQCQQKKPQLRLWFFAFLVFNGREVSIAGGESHPAAHPMRLSYKWCRRGRRPRRPAHGGIHHFSAPRRIRIIFKSAVKRVALAPAFYHKQNITGGPSFLGVGVLDDPLPDACRHAAHTREFESSPAVGTTIGRPSCRNHCRRGGRAMLVPTVVRLSCRRNGVERSPVLSANSPAFKPDPFR